MMHLVFPGKDVALPLHLVFPPTWGDRPAGECSCTPFRSRSGPEIGPAVCFLVVPPDRLPIDDRAVLGQRVVDDDVLEIGSTS